MHAHTGWQHRMHRIHRNWRVHGRRRGCSSASVGVQGRLCRTWPALAHFHAAPAAAQARPAWCLLSPCEAAPSWPRLPPGCLCHPSFPSAPAARPAPRSRLPPDQPRTRPRRHPRPAGPSLSGLPRPSPCPLRPLLRTLRLLSLKPGITLFAGHRVFLGAHHTAERQDRACARTVPCAGHGRPVIVIVRVLLIEHALLRRLGLRRRRLVRLLLLSLLCR